MRGPDRATLGSTLDELRASLSPAGIKIGAARLHNEFTLEIDLGFDDADCQECVLPADELGTVIADRIHDRVPGDFAVVVRDPRRVNPSRPLPERVRVLDPTGGQGSEWIEDEPALEGLVGRRIGIRLDILWRSWDWVTEEWAAAFTRLGGEVSTFRKAQGKVGEADEAQRRDYDEFLGRVDVAVVGLANCGSCTSWTIKDTITAARLGIPTVAVATAQFSSLAHTLARHYGRPNLRIAELPYPFDTLSADQVRAIAASSFGAMLETLGLPVGATS